MMGVCPFFMDTVTGKKNMLFRSVIHLASASPDGGGASALSWSVPLILGIFIAAALYLCNYEVPAKNGKSHNNISRNEKIKFSQELYFTTSLSVICILLLVLRFFFPELFLPKKLQEEKNRTFPGNRVTIRE